MKRKYTYYGTDTPIQVGDHVSLKIRRWFGPMREVEGVITYVHDPNQPVTMERDLRGLNDPVIDVQYGDGTVQPVGEPFEEVRLLERA